MSYNTVNLSVALDFNWLLAFVTLLTVVGSKYAYDHVIEADIFDDDTYQQELAIAGTSSGLLLFGAIAGGVPVFVALLSVIIGPWIIVATTLFTAAALIGMLIVLDDLINGGKQRITMAKRSLRMYARSLREAAQIVSNVAKR